MRTTWKVATLVAAMASLGGAGCGATPADPTEGAESALMTPNGEEADTDGALVSSEDTSEEADALAAQPIGPPIGPPLRPPFGPRFRPPLCRPRSRRVPVGRGYLCFGPGPFGSLPFCPGNWHLIRVGRGYMCERFLGPPHRPFER